MPDSTPRPPDKPYSTPRRQGRGGPWKYRLTAAGSRACAAYLRKHPSPMAFLRVAAPDLHARATADGNTREEVAAACLAAVAEAFLGYDPARGKPEAYVRDFVFAAARRALRRCEPLDPNPQADDDDAAPDPPAPDPPETHPLNTPAVWRLIRDACDDRQWAVVSGYFAVGTDGMDGTGPGDGTGEHVPVLAAAMGLTPGEYEAILKAAMKKLRAELATYKSGER